MELSTPALLALAATIASAAATVVAFRYRDERGGLAVIAFMAGITWWSGGVLGEHLAATYAGKLFWLNAQYPGVVVVPVAVVVFVFRFLGYDGWITRRRVALLASPLALLALLSWTNSVHGLVRTGSELMVVNGVTILVRDLGPAWWVGWVYSQILLIIAFVTLAYGIRDSAPQFRLQVAAILFGAGAPWIAGFVVFAAAIPFRPELLFSLTGVAFLVALDRTRLLRATPVAGRQVLEALPDPVLVIDDRDRIADANPAARAWFDLDDPVGLSLEAALATVTEIGEAYRTDGEGADPVAADTDGGSAGPVAVETGGETRYVAVRTVSLPDFGGRAPGEVLIARDVTASTRHERELAAANDRLKTLAHAMAHDLRNPLMVAQGFTELAADGDEGAIERIESSHSRMSEIIDESLAAVDVDPRDAESISVERVAREAWDTVETGDATLSVRGDATVWADEAGLRSVFENLFRNAAVHAGDAPDVTMTGVDEGFVVADDGPGIAPDERTTVFERGFTTSEVGTGVGLASVVTVADRQDWRIGVGAGPDGGAAFAVATGSRPLNSVAADAAVTGLVAIDAEN